MSFLKKGLKKIKKEEKKLIKKEKKFLGKELEKAGEATKTGPAKVFGVVGKVAEEADKFGLLPAPVKQGLGLFGIQTDTDVSSKQYKKDIKAISDSFHKINENQQLLSDLTTVLSENQEKISEGQNILSENITVLREGEEALGKDITVLSTGQKTLSTEVKELYDIDRRIIESENNIKKDITNLKHHSQTFENQQKLLDQKLETEIQEEEVEIQEIKNQMEDIGEKVLESFYRELDIKEMVSLLNMLDNKNEVINFLARHRNDFDKFNDNDKKLVLEVAKQRML